MHRRLEIYLHIGMNKVASTAIQEALAANRKTLLKRHSLLVPETGMGRGGRGGKSHFDLSEALGFTNDPAFLTPDDGRIAALRKAFDREVARLHPRSVMMSSEFFVLRRDVARVREFFDGMDVRIVICLRRHDEWLRSFYAQAVQSVPAPKWGRTLESFVDFQRAHRPLQLSYLDLVNAWSRSFGEGNLRLVIYREGGGPEDVIRDFLSAVGVADPSGLALADVRQNPSPSANILSIVDLVQRASLPTESRRAAVSRLVALASDGSPSLRLHAAARHRLVAPYLAEYRELSDRFLGGRPVFDLDLGPEAQTDPGAIALPSPVLTPEIRRALARHLSREEIETLVR
ncbi:hypothetical protein ACRDNQ_10535 [Palleronia sp. KMU-117]|uniref:hypothetical protein n=1 Tax=Palleronia sp. KMU-117 TaxID=3434108 RepID=UPI003D7290F3